MAQRIQNESTLISQGFIKGALYTVSYYPGFIETNSDSKKIWGELYQVDSNHLLASLDDFEGCSENYPDPKEYLRKQLPVYLTSGEIKHAWVYVYNRPVNHLQEITSGVWENSL